MAAAAVPMQSHALSPRPHGLALGLSQVPTSGHWAMESVCGDCQVQRLKNSVGVGAEYLLKLNVLTLLNKCLSKSFRSSILYKCVHHRRCIIFIVFHPRILKCLFRVFSSLLCGRDYKNKNNCFNGKKLEAQLLLSAYLYILCVDIKFFMCTPQPAEM